MGILNTHQVLRGARTPVQTKSYTLIGVAEKPTAAAVVDGGATGSALEFTGGTVEVEGKEFSLDGKVLDFFNLTALLKRNAEYTVGAVAKYDEPVSKSAAIAAGLNYYVYPNTQGQSVAEFFINPALEASVTAEGGYDTLADTILKGSPTVAQRNLFNDYELAIQQLSDPRYTAKLLEVKDVEFVLYETYPQSNASKADATEGLTKSDFDKLKAVVNLYKDKKVYTRAEAIAKFETGVQLHKVYSAVGYASAIDRTNEVNPIAINLSGATPFTTASTALFVTVIEYNYPSYTPLGQTGYRDGVKGFLTKQESAFLGRINPVYLAIPMNPVNMFQYPHSALTLHNDVASLVKVTTDSAGYPTNVVSNYDTLIGSY